MKPVVILAALLMTTFSIKAQKQEVKKAEYAVNSGNISEAASYLEQAKRIFAAADSETRARYYVVEAEMHLANNNMDMERLELISNALRLAERYDAGSSLLSRIADVNLKLKGLTATAAAGEYKNGKFSSAATLYKVAYHSTRDTVHLYNAARSHLLAKQYEEAFSAYQSLLEMGFTDAKIGYVATNIESGTKEAFGSTSLRDKAIAQKTHRKPEIIRSRSKTRDLLRALTATSVQLGRNNAAIPIVKRTLDKYPNDKALLQQVFHLYGQLGAIDKCDEVMQLLLAESPNDPELYYNFAVASSQNNDHVKAKELYRKALKLNPDHINSKINLSSIILDQERAFLKEMNGLGMSAEDDKRYEDLKQECKKLYFEALPYLESIVTIQPNNMEAVKTLMNVYGKMGQDSKYAVMKQRLDD